LTIWYAIRTRAQRELDTAQDLRKEGHTVFVPVERVRKPSRKGTKEYNRVLIPSYIFVAYTPWQHHKHVIGPVRMGGEPVKIPDGALAALFHATGRLVDHAAPKPPRQFKIEDVVTIAVGPLEGEEVIISAVLRKTVEVTTKIGRMVIPKSAIAA